jgi:glycosyltransferase involved in cell wall biosynthesis
MQMALRVLHILPSLRPDGGERIAVYVASRMDRRRFEPAVVSVNAQVGSDLERTLADAGVKVWFLGKGPGFDWRVYAKMNQVFREFQPDIVHTHLQVFRYVFPSLLLHKPRLMLHSVHNVADHELEWRGRMLQRVGYRFGIKPVAVAQEVARSVERVYNIRNCEAIWNCVPTDHYGHPQISREDWRAREGFTQDDVLFVCVARFFPQKNHPLLLQAFARGPAADPRARLLLVGTGPLAAQVQAEVKRLGLTDKVHFLGLRSDIPDLLAAMDAFVLSSDWEGAPVALIEAMAAGLPIIATAVGGVAESFQNQKEGILVQPGDAAGIANAMMTLLHSGELRRTMGAAAAVRAREQSDVGKMVRAYEDLYERSLAPAYAPAAVSANPDPQ